MGKKNVPSGTRREEKVDFSSTASEPNLKFIRDEPAAEDFFQTHTDVARAIARAIVTNPHLRTIGLMGRWGSGKSTVLRQLERLLPAQAPGKFRIFTYDAWLHQHDPVRRSFIEELMVFGEADGAAHLGEVEENLKELLGQIRKSDDTITPRLTTDATALLLSLLCYGAQIA